MTYLRTPEESPLYQPTVDKLGYLPNYARTFALAPRAYDAWLGLSAAVRAGMDERRYELVTLVAARRLGSRYCTLAHTAVLRERFYDEEALRAIVADRHTAGLDPADVAAMDFADRIATDPNAATEADVETLRQHGLSDADIFQVILAVTARRFFAGTIGAAGAVPDAVYDLLDPTLVTG
jgi:uncharacterized peroxidase-related enzyme